MIRDDGYPDQTWQLVDLFCGCGGASAGFLATGRYEHVFAADNDRHSVESYRTNLGYAPKLVDLGALADPDVAGEFVTSLALQRSRPTALVGCAPCQGFSSHAKTREDRRGRNSLLSVIGEVAAAMLPEAVFIENVPDLFSDAHWPTYLALRDRLESVGYVVRAKVVNFAQLGVPQERFRAVILAYLGRRPAFPAVERRSPLEFSTVKEWIGGLPPLSAGESDPDDPMHQASRHRPETVKILQQVPIDGGRRPVGVGPACLDATRSKHGGYTDVYGRLSWSEPAPTITARCRTPSCGRFAHPEEHRGMTAREAALLQTFPKTWQFCGPFDDRFKQIGNAVPPLAAAAFANVIAAGVDFEGGSEDEVGVREITDEPVGKSFSVLIPGIRRRAHS